MNAKAISRSLNFYGKSKHLQFVGKKGRIQHVVVHFFGKCLENILKLSPRLGQ